MADTRFIKATAFCGYDKADVDKRLETLYSLIYNLKNEVRECRQIIRKYEEGFDHSKAYENAIAVERAQLTQLQVKNEKLSEKNKLRKDELNAKEEENAKLHEEINRLRDELEALRLKHHVLKNNDTEDLGIIFKEAKKSRDLIVNKAKKDAEDCKQQAESFANNLIDETNRRIAELITNAEKKATGLISDAQNKVNECKSLELSIKNTILIDAKNISGEISKIKNVFAVFGADTSKFIANSERILAEAERKIVGESATTQDPSQTSAAHANNSNHSDDFNKPTDNDINLDDLLKQAKELNKM